MTTLNIGCRVRLRGKELVGTVVAADTVGIYPVYRVRWDGYTAAYQYGPEEIEAVE